MLKLNSLETSKFLSGFNGKIISFDSKHTSVCVMLRIVLNHSCEDELVCVQYLCTKKQCDQFSMKSLFLFRTVEAEKTANLTSFR